MTEINKKIIIDEIEYILIPVCRETEPKCVKPTFNDWRLPTIGELKTLVNYEKDYLACDLEDTTADDYWSCSSYVSDPSHAWIVDFSNGRVDYNLKHCTNLVRCVRDGEKGLEWSASSDIEMYWDEAMDYAKNLVAPVYYKEKQ